MKRRICGIADCGRTTVARGLCYRHYSRAWKGQRLPESVPPAMRLNVFQETSGSCMTASTPCPEHRCRYHLAEDRPGQDLSEPCAMLLALAGPMTLEAVGVVLGLTRERVRQIEVGALYKIRRLSGEALGFEQPRPRRKARSKVPPRLPPGERWSA